MEFQTVNSESRRNLLYPKNWNYIQYSVLDVVLMIYSGQLPNVPPFDPHCFPAGTFSLKYFRKEVGSGGPIDVVQLVPTGSPE